MTAALIGPIDAEQMQTVELADDRALDVTPCPDGAHLRLRSLRTGEALEIEVRFGPSGPIVRVASAELEIESATRIVAQCDDFAVHARNSIELESGGSIVQRSRGPAKVEAHSVAVDASPGAVRVRANDDVQLLGEQILLNCDRAPAMPAWVPPGREQIAALPPASQSGDDDVLAEMLETPT